jgi:hypothetical protein
LDIKYLDKRNHNFPDDKFDILLSPAFYWIKKVDVNLPDYKIKKIADSFFEGELPKGEFEFYIKNGFIIAYSKEDIKNYLEKHNVNISNVNKIYFAQFELRGVLPTFDDIVLCTPTQKIDTTKIEKLTKNYVHFNSISLETRDINFIIISLIVLTVVNLANVGFLSSKYSTLLNEISKIYNKYNLPATSYQLEAELEKYKNINDTQTELRNKIYKITKQHKKVEKIEIDNNKIKVEYKSE